MNIQERAWRALGWKAFADEGYIQTDEVADFAGKELEEVVSDAEEDIQSKREASADGRIDAGDMLESYRNALKERML